MQEDPAEFSRLLPLYRSRILYIGWVWIVVHLGIAPVLASNVVSAVSVTLGLFVLHRICTRHVSIGTHAMLILWTFMAGVVRLSRLSSPDAMLFLFTMMLVLSILEKRPWTPAILFLMVLTRTDVIAAVIPVMMSLAVLERAHRKRWIAYGILSTAIVIFLHGVTGYPGWIQAFRFTFFGRHLTDGAIQPAEYFGVFLRGSSELVHRKVFLIAGAAAAGLTVAVRMRKQEWRDADPLQRRAMAVFGGMAISIALRMVLFPLPDLRFFTASLIVMALTGSIVAERLVFSGSGHRITPGSD